MSRQRKFSKEELLAHRLAGQQRAVCEHKLLLLMFDGFSHLHIDPDKYDYICMLNEHCGLDKYTHLIRADLDQDYSSLTPEGKAYFHVLAALDSLVLNGLAERKIWFSNDHSPEDGFSNLDGKLSGTQAQDRSWLAHGLLVSDTQEKSFQLPEYMRGENAYPTIYTLEYIEYQLTTKGFDVALKFQEHNDQEQRFILQAELTDKAVQASASSAKTARIALWAAATIALGSVGNLVFSLLTHFSLI